MVLVGGTILWTPAILGALFWTSVSKQHWDQVWTDQEVDDVSWYQANPELSLELIRSVSTPEDSVVDVGGGASRLVDNLLASGYGDLAVLDIAEAAFEPAKARLGGQSEIPQWVADDVLTHNFERQFDVWHDRAVFHFLTEAADRSAYLERLGSTLKTGGHMVLATFADDGPEACSGLPTQQYGRDLMVETLGVSFSLIEFRDEDHPTPGGASQKFLYGVFRHTGPNSG